MSIPAHLTVDSAMFTFYDIESLANVFTVSAFTPRRGPGIRPAVKVFHLVDDAGIVDDIDPVALKALIRERNPALPGDAALELVDLRTATGAAELAALVGLSNAAQVNDPSSVSNYDARLRPVCDTDPDYDPARHPFLAGYNSANYDTVMLALYLMESGIGRADRAFTPVSAKVMRAHNDALFSDDFRRYMPGYLISRAVTKGAGWNSPQKRIHQAMIHSGRHLDVARLNEAQQRVGLKRLLGMLGHQILESDKLGGHNAVVDTIDDLYELVAYNVSDCVGLGKLMHHTTYASAFELKHSLMSQYPETVYETGHAGDNRHVRRDRLTPDTSSAKFVGRILCPDGHLDDIPAVSFLYPSQRVADERGVERVDVLEESRRFFEANVTADPNSDAHRRFMDVYDYYASIRGHNFNDSSEYAEKYGRALAPQVLGCVPKTANNLPYFTSEAKWSSCFATFSTGGIHGAEADLINFIVDEQKILTRRQMLELARCCFPEDRGGARAFVEAARRQHNELRLPDGATVDKRLVLLGSDPARVKYRKPKKDDPNQCEQLSRAQALVEDPAALLATQRPEDEKLFVWLVNHHNGTRVGLDGQAILASTTVTGAAFRDVSAVRRPELFETRDDGSTKLKAKYALTSADPVTHEDFTSYYPNLLRNMSAFYNEALGEDRYAKIFEQKESLGRAMKHPGITPEEKARLSTLRNGTKLILNSASGAGDASHRTPIRMNNQIISMRVIGQLFSWRIGQAQTLAGARIISTNTDGLYSVLDPGVNNRVLAEQAALINVDIEPEPMFLISKDSNNRLELTAPGPGQSIADARLISASGGTLSCHAGPRPDKALAHPAVVDHVLAQYLQWVAARKQTDPAAFSRPFDRARGRQLVEGVAAGDDLLGTVLLFQTMVTASPGSITYPFAVDPLDAQKPAVDPLDAAGEQAVDAVDAGEQTDEDDQDRLDVPLRDRHPRALQHFNRAFLVRPGTAEAVNLLNAGAWVVNPASRQRRERDGVSSIETDPVARIVLEANGWSRDGLDGFSRIPADQDVAVRKINSIDPSWSVLVDNRDLHELADDELRAIVDALDLQIYTDLLDETYTKNWMNAPMPGQGPAPEEAEEAEDFEPTEPTEVPQLVCAR